MSIADLSIAGTSGAPRRTTSRDRSNNTLTTLLCQAQSKDQVTKDMVLCSQATMLSTAVLSLCRLAAALATLESIDVTLGHLGLT